MKLFILYLKCKIRRTSMKPRSARHLTKITRLSLAVASVRESHGVVLDLLLHLPKFTMSNPLERYQKLGLSESLPRIHRYPLACKELSFILRGAYAKFPKNLQALIFQDTFTAFRLLPGYVYFFLLKTFPFSRFSNSSLILFASVLIICGSSVSPI